MLQRKKLPKRALSISGSLAYYNLLAGMTFTPAPLILNRETDRLSSDATLTVAEAVQVPKI